MKKSLLITTIIGTFLLTGCSDGKKIECAFYEEDDNNKITYDYEFNYDESGNNLQKITMFTEMSFKDDNYFKSLGSASDFCEAFTKDENDKNIDNVECKQKQENNSVSIEIVYNVSQMDSEQRKNLISNFDMTFWEFKNNYDENEYETDYCVFNSKQKMDPVKKEDGVLDLISNAKKSAAIDSTYGVIKTTESFVAKYMMEHNGDWNENVTFICNGNNCSGKIKGKEYNLELNGAIPTSGSIYIDKNGSVTIKDELVINGYSCHMSNDDVICSK